MICLIAGCGKPVYKRGICAMHSSRIRRHGDPDCVHGRGPSKNPNQRRGPLKNPKPRLLCAVSGCGRLHHAKGCCVRCYRRRCRQAVQPRHD